MVAIVVKLPDRSWLAVDAEDAGFGILFAIEQGEGLECALSGLLSWCSTTAGLWPKRPVNHQAATGLEPMGEKFDADELGDTHHASIATSASCSA